MKIKVLIAVSLLVLSFTLSADETPQSDSNNSQTNKAAAALTSNNPAYNKFASPPKDNPAQMSATPVTNDISEIRNNTKETAKNTKKDWHDNLGIVLSALAFITAGITLIFTVRTYKSQKKTQRNTIPKANKKIQRYLLNNLIIRLFDGHMQLTALWYLLNEKEYHYYPSEQILRKTKLPSDTIFTYLFYTEDDEKEKNIDKNQVDYRTVQGFSEKLDDYNMSIEELEMHLKEKNTPQELLYLEFFKLLEKNDEIATIWGKVMTILFMYNDEMKSAIFEVLIEEYAIDGVEDDNTLTNKGFYKPDEVYSEYLLQEDNKKKLLAYMEKRTASYKNEFEYYLIERK